jgi:hypothetical protein
VEIKAKRDRANQAEQGETPIEYATRHNYEQIEKILEKHKTQLKAQSFPTFIPESKKLQFYKHGAPFFLISFAFLNPTEVRQMKIENMSTMQELAEEIYNLLEMNWLKYKEAIAETLYPFSPQLNKQLNNATNKKEFYNKLINIYTSNYVYSKVNEAMRRASALQAPTGDDMLLSLYSLCLQAVLINWDQLEPFTGTTFRGMTLEKDQSISYTQGTKFIWFSFTSASQKEQVAGGFIQLNKSDICKTESETTFIIENKGMQSKLKPVKIDKFSDYEGEQEVLYPAGTAFQVDKVEELVSYKKVYLSLLNK